MNDIDFFTQIVLPTVADFSRNPGDIRLGVLACVVLQAMNEHYFHHNQADPGRVHGCISVADFKGALRTRDWSFGQIMDIANGTKHAVPKPGKTGLNDLHQAVPNEMGVLRAGFPLSPERHLFIDGDNAWMLNMLTDHVAETWKTILDTNCKI
jgi:hypothetical protein